ncbi:MAG: hypothetical protein ACI8Z5_001505 [Lentimonas sp.]|jgi:hypothetical protein
MYENMLRWQLHGEAGAFADHSGDIAGAGVGVGWLW